MPSWKWGRPAAIGLVAVAAAISAGATAFGATQGGHPAHAIHSNYRGPARMAPAVKFVTGTNYRGPARHAAPERLVHGSNRHAPVTSHGGAH